MVMPQVIRLLHGDSFKRIEELAVGDVIAVITDPPYGISFMGKDWDSPELTPSDTEPSEEEDAPGPSTQELHSFQEWALGWLKLCFDKLPSGGVVKIFGATRTFHRMAAAMEQVGFTSVGIEAWMYGSGFPKSLNVGKALDRVLGVSPTVVGHHGNPEPRTVDRIALDFGGATGKAKNGLKDRYPITEGASEKAKEYAGYGTALKPSWEPFLVGKKP